VVPINVLKLYVHKRIKLHGNKASAAPIRGGCGCDESKKSPGVADRFVVRREDEGEAAPDGRRIEIGDGEGKEGGEAGRKAVSRKAEPDRTGVQSSPGAGGGNGKVAREAYGAVVKVSVAEKLEAFQCESSKVELGPCGYEVDESKNKEH